MPSLYQLEPQSEAALTSDPLTEDNSGTARNPALWLAAALVFVRFSMLNEVLAHLTGLNIHLLYIVGVPALLAVFLKGRLRDTLRTAPALFWVGFGLWLVVATPFSIWKGGSAHTIVAYFKSELVMLFVVGALARTWRDCKLLMYAIAAAAMMSIAVSKIFAANAGTGRLDLEFGTVSNANDFAAHLLLVLPFLLWIALSSTSRIFRLIALLGVSYGTYVLLASGSRGALIALAADLLFFTINAGPRHRLALLILAPLVLGAGFAALPHIVARRLTSFSAAEADASREALASTYAREVLLRDSLVCTLHNPILGIGPGQFTTFEGDISRPGTGTYWHNAHNSYAAAASEAGLPGLFFYVAAVLSTWRLLKRILRRSRSEPGIPEASNAVLCVMIAVLGFCTAIFFLNFTYTFYLPALSGLAIALNRATEVLPNRCNEEEQNAAVALHLAWNGSTPA